ncbi:MAG: hypothetical protein CSA72_05880 [Rhodobacterales bacterium]|nr:MAG: hypothetical protein CSA72_05880 [Rhodobacterales bacterium]
MTRTDFWLWLALAWLWGSSFLAIGIGVETLSPAALVALRMAIGTLALVGILYASGGSLRLGRRGWRIAGVVGMTGNVIPFLLISYAEQQVDSGLAALIMGIAPVVTLTLAPLIHPDESVTRTLLLGAALGFSGVAVLVGPEALQGVSGELMPRLALVGAALCYSATALISRRYPHPEPLQMAAGSVLAGALVIGAMAAPGWDMQEIRASSLWAAVYLGLGPTALAAVIYFHLIPRIGASRLQQVNYVVPVLGTVLGIIVLGERPGWNSLLAIVMIAGAIWLVTRRR